MRFTAALAETFLRWQLPGRYLFAGGVKDHITGRVYFGYHDDNSNTGNSRNKTPSTPPFCPTNRCAHAGHDPINNIDPNSLRDPEDVTTASVAQAALLGLSETAIADAGAAAAADLTFTAALRALINQRHRSR